MFNSKVMFCDDTTRWSAVVSRNPHADGSFVYAVTTTNIYCRPTCKARRARRTNVTFFTNPADAEFAGFRACKRCRPELMIKLNPEAERIARACELLRQLSADGQIPTLEQLAIAVRLSKYHFHRLFKRETGLTPREYLLELRSHTGYGSTSLSTTTPLYFDGNVEKLAKVKLAKVSSIGNSSSSELDELDFKVGTVPVHYCILNSGRSLVLAAFQQRFITWTTEDSDEVALMEKFEAAFPALFYNHIPVGALDTSEAESMITQLKKLSDHDCLALPKSAVPVGRNAQDVVS